MALTPGYGETPLDPEEADALTSQARELLGGDPRKADLYEAEQAILAEVSEQLFDAVADGILGSDEILSDYFLRDLHRKLYGDIWTWAGRFRIRELNIGIHLSRSRRRFAPGLRTPATAGSTPRTGHRANSE